MRFVGKSPILRMRPKKGVEYPLIRFPKEYSRLIGKEAYIFEIEDGVFLVTIRLYNRLYNLF